MASFEERANRYSTQREIIEAPRYNFDIQTLDSFCAYALSENAGIHRNALMSLRDLLRLIGEEQYQQDQACIERIRFCLAVLEIRMDKGIKERSKIIQSLLGIYATEFQSIDPNMYGELDNNTVAWIENLVSSCSNMAFIRNEVLSLGRLCGEFMNADYNHLQEIGMMIKDKVADMHTKFRRNDIEQVEADNTMFLENIGESIHSIYNEISRPSHKLRTGMQAFNGIIAGGFVTGVYCLFGLPGEGKTITLINLAYQIREYNKDYVCRDKTKKPIIVFLTMENMVSKVTETLFNIACSPKPFTELDEREVNELVEKHLKVTDDNPIGIQVRYKPINSVDTSYIYKLVDDLSDAGYETICVIQDYIKRIRPEDRTRDMRLDLGNVINDFSNIAKHYKIPVITASQFNREGVKTIDEARGSNRHDLVNKLGRHMIGESGLIDENLDCSIFLAKEIVLDDFGNKQIYMGFSCTKSRNRLFTDVVKFYQPFREDNPIAYVCDEFGQPVFRKSLQRDEEGIAKTYGNSVNVSLRKKVKNITDLENDAAMVNGVLDPSLEARILQGSVAVTPPPQASIQNSLAAYDKPMINIVHRNRDIVRRIE